MEKSYSDTETIHYYGNDGNIKKIILNLLK